MLQCWTSEIPFCGLHLSSLNWQHQLCKNPRPNPDIKTLFTDHSCTPPNGALAPTPVNLPSAAVAKPAVYTSLGAHSVWYLSSGKFTFSISIYNVVYKKKKKIVKFLINVLFCCLQPFPPTAAAANANALAGWMANAAVASSSVQAAVVTASSLPVQPNQGQIFTVTWRWNHAIWFYSIRFVI